MNGTAVPVVRTSLVDLVGGLGPVVVGGDLGLLERRHKGSGPDWSSPSCL